MPDSAAEVFDPRSLENIAATLAVELIQREVHHLPPQKPFRGPGIYALYYSGDHDAYAMFTAKDSGSFKYPLYIGKAAAENARQGFTLAVSTGRSLYNRIRAHAKSIEPTDLSLEDFRCRYLVLNDADIPLAESIMIRVFRPPWNGMGIGSNPVGGPRMGGEASLWDSLHPGRPGRPVGNTERQKKAREMISDRFKEMHSQFQDPRMQRVQERIMRFVE